MTAILETLGSCRQVNELELAKNERVAKLLTSTQRETIGSILQILPDINSRTRIVFDGAETVLIGQIVDDFENGQVVGEKVDIMLMHTGTPSIEPTGLSTFVVNEMFLMSQGQMRATHETPVYSILETEDLGTRVIFIPEQIDSRRRIKKAKDPKNPHFVNLGA